MVDDTKKMRAGRSASADAKTPPVDEKMTRAGRSPSADANTTRAGMPPSADDLSAPIGTGWLKLCRQSGLRQWVARHFRLERHSEADGGWALAYCLDSSVEAERRGRLQLAGAKVTLPPPDADDGLSFMVIVAEGVRLHIPSMNVEARLNRPSLKG